MLTGLIGSNPNFFFNSSDSVAQKFLIHAFIVPYSAAAFVSSVAKCYTKDETIGKTNAKVM